MNDERCRICREKDTSDNGSHRPANRPKERIRSGRDAGLRLVNRLYNDVDHRGEYEANACKGKNDAERDLQLRCTKEVEVVETSGENRGAGGHQLTR